MTLQPVEAIVMDIEGTTSAARHVYDVLFPYARTHLRTWIEEHPDDPTTSAAVAQVAAELGVDPSDVDAVVAQLVRWIDDDVKAAPLKSLQGLIWEQGYARGELTSHMFDDVEPVLRAWKGAGIALVIYSSGSVAAQKALFANAPQGNLDELVDANFDITTAGPKREPASYERIAETLGIVPERLLFLSDVQAEIDAAHKAGWQAIGVLRQGETQATAAGPDIVDNFADIHVKRAI